MGGALRAAAPGAFCSPCSAPQALSAPHVLYANVLHGNQQIARKKQAPMQHLYTLRLCRRRCSGGRALAAPFQCNPQTMPLKLFSEKVSSQA